MSRLRPRGIAVGQGVLVALRHAARLKQAQVAARLGVHPSMIDRWESGKQLLPPGRVGDLAAALGVAVEAILGDTPLSPETAFELGLTPIPDGLTRARPTAGTATVVCLSCSREASGARPGTRCPRPACGGRLWVEAA